MGNSLYLKYRPQNFDEVIGQEVAKKILINSILEDKINHAYLFFGIRGTGKTTLARIFAKAINCKNREGANPCGKCTSCKEITTSSAMDVIEIDAASNNGVDEIRSLTEKTNYFATSLTYKVYIIDEVHMLSKSAFNALLKTLEEPPENTIFLLATTEINKIPETILSRTIIINLEILSNTSVLKGIEFILEKEEISYEKEALKYIVLVAGGSLRDAITALETVLLFNNKVSVENVVKALGLIKYEDIENLLKTNILQLADLINSVDNDPKKIIHILIEVITNLVRNGKGDYKPLLSDILNIFISIKDPSLIKISLYSLLTTYSKEISFPVDYTKVEKDLSTNEESSLLEKETQEIKEESSIDRENQEIEKEPTTITLQTVDDSKKDDQLKEQTSFKDFLNDVPKDEIIQDNNLKEEEIANVSRETLQESEIELEEKLEEETTEELKEENKEENKEKTSEEIISHSIYNAITEYLTIESYLTILFEAEVQLLEKVKKRWEFIVSYSSNNKYKPFIKVLLNATPLVVNKQALILGFENEKDINELKRISLNKELLEFIDEILGYPLLVLPVTPNSWSKMLKAHKQLLNKGSEIKKPIVIPENILKNNDANETLLKSLFGDKLEYE